MKPVIQQCLTLLALTCACVGGPRADNSLSMHADTPEVSVESRATKRSFLRLPTLQYAFRFDAVCSANLKPVSLLLSVADTRKTLDANEIEANATTAVSLSIPASQIAPVAIQGFCEQVDSREDGGGQRRQRNEYMTIPAALSAQASLRCASESGEQTVYVSWPLDVKLICRRQPAAISLR